jgi:hypothetical protein
MYYAICQGGERAKGACTCVKYIRFAPVGNIKEGEARVEGMIDPTWWEFVRILFGIVHLNALIVLLNPRNKIIINSSQRMRASKSPARINAA